MSKPKADLPSHFIALVFESSPSLRAAMMVKIVQFTGRVPGPGTGVPGFLRDTVATYRAAGPAAGRPNARCFRPRPAPRHGLMLRVRHGFEELRNRCVHTAARPCFWKPAQAAVPCNGASVARHPPCYANDREIEERKLPPADELWERLAAKIACPRTTAPRSRRSRLKKTSTSETWPRAVIAGTVDRAKMDEIRAREEQKRGKEGWWAIESRVLDRAEQLIEIEERQMKAKGQQPQQPGK
ncbi:MAG: hypothetical protein KF754_13490 [Planctomycetes bacterium]|nr:hypothetical protein [Planctomycetota bacterium]